MTSNMPASNSARLFISLVVVAGSALFALAMVHPTSDSLLRFLSFLAIALVAARLRVKLPGVTGIMSVNLPFILLAVAQMNLAEAMVVACLSTFAQCVPQSGKKLNWIKAVFNVANMVLVVEATRAIYASALLGSAIKSRPLLLAVAAAGFFMVNTVPVAMIIALTESKNVFRAWAAMFQLSFPYFLGSAGVAAVALTVSLRFGWQIPLFVLPLMLAVFFSYKRYFAAAALMEADNKRPVQNVAVAEAAS